jgi:hypothetical protein
MDPGRHGEQGDGWSIGRGRGLPRRRRLEDVLLDRRLRDLNVPELAAQVERLEEEVTVLRARLGAPEQLAPGHVLFFPAPDGYAIVESGDPPPPVGQLLMLDEGCFRVLRAGRSPFPLDRRRCLFLETAEPT